MVSLLLLNLGGKIMSKGFFALAIVGLVVLFVGFAGNSGFNFDPVGNTIDGVSNAVRKVKENPKIKMTQLEAQKKTIYKTGVEILTAIKKNDNLIDNMESKINEIKSEIKKAKEEGKTFNDLRYRLQRLQGYTIISQAAQNTKKKLQEKYDRLRAASYQIEGTIAKLKYYQAVKKIQEMGNVNVEIGLDTDIEEMEMNEQSRIKVEQEFYKVTPDKPVNDKDLKTLFESL